MTLLEWLLLGGLTLLAIGLIRVVLHHLETRRALKELQRLNQHLVNSRIEGSLHHMREKGGDA